MKNEDINIKLRESLDPNTDDGYRKESRDLRHN